MSDPVSNSEIEDVLSSIRRLVSEEPSPLHRRKAAEKAEKDRFVLTPALRVSEDGDEQDADGEAAGAEAGDDVDDRFARSRQTLEQRIAELEAALQQSPEEWEPDGSEMTGSQAPDMPSVADAPDAGDGDAGNDWNADALAKTPEEDRAEPAAEADAEAVPVDDTEAEAAEPFEDEVAKADADAGDETTPDADDPQDDPFSAWSTDTGLAEDEDTAPASEAGDAADDTPEPKAEAENAPETADAPVPEAEMPDSDAADDAAAFRHAVFAAKPRQAPEERPGDDAAEPAEETGRHAAGSRGFALFEEDSVLDEEALRDLVSQIVRDELQGVLGERITRNVRRLVRREIQRAIAMRELE